MTYSNRFLACLPFVLHEEGGFSNTPGDHGGATNYGIIQREYDLFRHSLGLPMRSVRLITQDEYETIYWQSYWQPHCPDLRPGVDLTFFNIAVNGGVRRAVILLQRVCGVDADGVWGPATAAAVAALGDTRSAIARFHDLERAFYDAIVAHDPSQRKFLSDWRGRNDRCERASLLAAESPGAEPAKTSA